MSIRKKLAAAVLSLGLITGSTVMTSLPAQAGQSIGWTYNGRTNISYAYYASTDHFALRRSHSYDPSYMRVNFYDRDGSYAGHLTLSGAGVGDSASINVKYYFGFSEGKTYKFKLMNASGDKSYGYFTV